MSKLNDNSLMLTGTYKGKPLCKIPASYLLSCYNKSKLDNDLKEYIEENMDVLKCEVKEERQFDEDEEDE
jgi:uncharacterized protein (DUF3820 family)